MNIGVVGALCAVWVALAAAIIIRPRARSRSGPRPLSPVTTAAAVCGENVCAVGLVVLCAAVYAHGLHVLWLVIAVGAGFLMYAVLVAGPLRRSHVFSLADFVEWRLESRKLRRITTCCALAICLCLLIAQFRFVGDIVAAFTGWPAPCAWIGLAVLTLIILGSGRPGAGAGFQSLGFWVKCVGFTVPALILLAVGAGPGSGATVERDTSEWMSLALPPGTLLSHYSVALALMLGVIGHPLFVFRYYGTRNTAAARDTGTVTLALMASLVVLPFVFAILAHATVPNPPGDIGETFAMLMLLVPQWVAPGPLGTALTAVLVAVTLATTVAVVVALASAVGSHVSQCKTGGGFGLYSAGATAASVVPAILLASVPVLHHVDMFVLVLSGFHVGAVTLAPVLLLGIWWRGLTAAGAGGGMLVGLGMMGLAAVGILWDHPLAARIAPLTTYPALIAVPTVVAVAVGVSLVLRRRQPQSAAEALATLHGMSDAPRG